MALALPAAVAGCAKPSLNPIDWWHNLEGGPIADERPPPPNVDAPYPNLSLVPARPPAPDQAARARIAGGLVADRTNAQYAATVDPLPPPAATLARPAPARPIDPTLDTAGASLPAVSAPPPPGRVGPLGPPQPNLPDVPVTAPRRAPVSTVQSAALTPPATATPAAAAAPASPASALPPPGVGTPAQPLATLPPIPNAPPPPPQLPGATTFVAPTPPPATPPPPPPPPVVVAPGAPVLVAFPPGAATLPADSLGALKLLIRQRTSDGVINVTGYGDAASADPAAQAAALPLALARARAIAANLLASGVPSAMIRINAEAQGRGGAAKIAN